jgi:uncharacterized membrane protein YphA (DoxX/SURF4 family)
MARVERPSRLLTALQLACRAALVVVLLWSGIAKAMDRQTAILAVSAYDLLPGSLAEPVGTLLPWLEIALGLLLLLGLFLRPAAIAAAALTIGFLVAMGQAKARGLQIDCGCFGGGGPGEGVTWLDLGRDAALLLAAVFLAWMPSGPLQLDRFLLKEDGHDARDERDKAAVEG